MGGGRGDEKWWTGQRILVEGISKVNKRRKMRFISMCMGESFPSAVLPTQKRPDCINKSGGGGNCLSYLRAGLAFSLLCSDSAFFLPSLSTLIYTGGVDGSAEESFRVSREMRPALFAFTSRRWGGRTFVHRIDSLVPLPSMRAVTAGSSAWVFWDRCQYCTKDVCEMGRCWYWVSERVRRGITIRWNHHVGFPHRSSWVPLPLSPHGGGDSHHRVLPRAKWFVEQLGIAACGNRLCFRVTDSARMCARIMHQHHV